MKNLKSLLLGCILLPVAAMAATVPVPEGADLQKAIRDASPADTLLLTGGSYTMTAQVALEKDLYIVAAPGVRPVVGFTNFVLGNGAENLLLEGLHIVYRRRYLFYNTGDKPSDIENITLRNCVIDLAGDQGSSIFYNNAVAAPNRVGTFAVENCIVFNAGSASHGVVNGGKDSNLQIARISLKNSTFADFMRGIVLVNAPMDDLLVEVENCSFYRVNKSSNAGAIFHAALGNTEFKITGCVFDFGDVTPKFIDAGGGGIVSVKDSWSTVKPRNPYTLQVVKGKRMYAAPADDPTAGDASFRITADGVPDGKAGDPRWY